MSRLYEKVFGLLELPFWISLLFFVECDHKPAKSGNEENSIEKDTKDSSRGALAFDGGVSDNVMGDIAIVDPMRPTARTNTIEDIMLIGCKRHLQFQRRVVSYSMKALIARIFVVDDGKAHQGQIWPFSGCGALELCRYKGIPTG